MARLQRHDRPRLFVGSVLRTRRPTFLTRPGSGYLLIDDDIRDGASLERAFSSFVPDVVFHMAAQPLVRCSYQDPIRTFETNVIGTASVLDATRRTPTVQAVVIVTTDKCYDNKEWLWGYRETDPLSGYDPYSSSKAGAETVSAAYRQSYFPVTKLSEHHCAVATGRAGNVIGGGDWSTEVLIRHPKAIRPWQQRARTAPWLHLAGGEAVDRRWTLRDDR